METLTYLEDQIEREEAHSIRLIDIKIRIYLLLPNIKRETKIGTYVT